LHRVITSEEALQRYTGYILATPELGLRLLNNPDLYHRSVSGTEHSCATLPSQGALHKHNRSILSELHGYTVSTPNYFFALVLKNS